MTDKTNTALKINIKNRERFEQALVDCQPRAKVRLLDLDDIDEAISDAEATLQSMLLKKDWKDIEILVTVGAKVASSYNGIPQSTFVGLRRYASGWFATKVYRGKSLERDNGIYHRLKIPKSKTVAMLQRLNTRWV